MSIPFKKIQRKNPGKLTIPGKYYPQLITVGRAASLGSVAYLMKDKSSLSYGDIKSVLTNFVEVMRQQLFSGKSVNIEDFGVFSISAGTVGTDKKEECTAKSIRTVRINFRASSGIRPNLASTTRTSGETLEFIDIETWLKEKGVEPDVPVEPVAPIEPVAPDVPVEPVEPV